jgi:serine/threonine protein phosphatase PrpC
VISVIAARVRDLCLAIIEPSLTFLFVPESPVAHCAGQLCDLCLSMGSKDNMTALVVKFPAQTSGPGGGVLARRQLRDEAVQSSNSSSGGGTYGSNAVS